MLDILTRSDVRKKFHITVDTAVENAIAVHVGEGKTIKFAEVGSDFLSIVETN